MYVNNVSPRHWCVQVIFTPYLLFLMLHFVTPLASTRPLPPPVKFKTG